MPLHVMRVDRSEFFVRPTDALLAETLVLISPTLLMRFSRNQILGAFILLAVIWAVILYRVIFSAA